MSGRGLGALGLDIFRRTVPKGVVDYGPIAIEHIELAEEMVDCMKSCFGMTFSPAEEEFNAINYIAVNLQTARRQK